MESRIIVCGLNGVGKSTFGKALAEQLGYRFVDIEDLYFPKTDQNYIYATPRTEEEVREQLLEIIQSGENFVLSSVTGKYIENLSKYFQYCILLHVNREDRLQRVKERSIHKFGERALPGGDLYEKEQGFYRMVASRSETLVEEWAETLSIPIIRLNGEKTIEDNLLQFQGSIP